jgi:hypothetical protein
MKTVAGLEAALKRAGFQVIGRFLLPAPAWWDDSYLPLERRLDALEEGHAGDADVQSPIGMTRQEMAVHRDHHEEFGYVFFWRISHEGGCVPRTPDGRDPSSRIAFL